MLYFVIKTLLASLDMFYLIIIEYFDNILKVNLKRINCENKI